MDEADQVKGIPRERVRKGTLHAPNCQSLTRRFFDYDLRPYRLGYTPLPLHPSKWTSGPPLFSKRLASPSYLSSLFYTLLRGRHFKCIQVRARGCPQDLAPRSYRYFEGGRYLPNAISYSRSFRHSHVPWIFPTQVLLLSDVGPSLDSFEQPLHVRCVQLHSSACLLTRFSKRPLRALVLLHEAGIYHDDFCPRSTAKGFIMDFNHAFQGHHCPGMGQCDELIQARQDLGLDPGTEDPHRHFWTLAIVLACIGSFFAMYQHMYSM
jgi:hypothetical protein